MKPTELLKKYQKMTKGKTPFERKKIWEKYREEKKKIFGEDIVKVKSNKNFISYYRNKQVKNATNAEKVYRDFLDKNKINYKFQKPIKVDDKWYIMDFYLPESKLCIEIDGGYHTKENQRKNDEERDKDLLSIDITTIRYTNEEIFDKFK